MHASLRDILIILAQDAIVAVSAFLVVAAIVRSGASPLLQAIGLAIPAIAGCVGAYLAGGVEPAITLLIACTVCAMLFCNGAAMFLATPKDSDPPPAGPVATLIFPLGIVLLLGGFAAHSTAAGLVGLLVVGLLSLDLARGDAAAGTGTQRAGRFAGWLVALAPAAILGFSVMSIMKAAQSSIPLVRSDAFLVLTVSPALVLPLLVRSMGVAGQINLSAATRLTATFSCLVLGVILPLLILVDYGMQRWHSELAVMGGLPPISWRIDSPLLVMAGFGMLGMRLGYLKPDRWVAMLFVLIYMLYILTGTISRIG